MKFPYLRSLPVREQCPRGAVKCADGLLRANIRSDVQRFQGNRGSFVRLPEIGKSTSQERAVVGVITRGERLSSETRLERCDGLKGAPGFP
ncbi:hypothetical protein ATKI12_3287 [Kitasatospora sp. Ki12]